MVETIITVSAGLIAVYLILSIGGGKNFADAFGSIGKVFTDAVSVLQGPKS